MSSEPDVMVTAYLFNKNEHYEKALKDTGKDLRKTEVAALIKSIGSNAETICERRKLMRGCGLLYVHQGKIKDLLHELFVACELGFYHSTISLCGTVAERVCYDFIDFADIKINEKVLDQATKSIFYELPFRQLLSFLVALSIIKPKHVKLLHQIYDIRNRYVHAKTQGDAHRDALWCLNHLSEVLEDLFAMSRFYDLKDGKFYMKSEYRKTASTK